MALRRLAITLAAVLVLAAPGCRFSRSSTSIDDAASTSTTASTLSLFEETATSLDETTTTTPPGGTSTTRKPVASTSRPATTRAASATTARPAVPHCNAAAGDTYYGTTWTVSVSSTFPSSNVVIDLKWGQGNAGNYSGVTDGNGSWTKTQRVQPSMRGQRVQVNVNVASRVSCATSFTVS